MNVQLLRGDCVEVLAGLDENSIDSCVTDPPYELWTGNGKGFMGQKWDGSGVSFNPETWKAVLRVLKPGGHLLAFAGARTYHRIACAIEDAGFEIRDQIMWVYGSGFPHSLSVHKTIAPVVEARYGTSTCNCLDSRDGCPLRDDVRHESSTEIRLQRASSQQASPEIGHSFLSLNTSGGGGQVPDMRTGDVSEASRPTTCKEIVLLEEVCSDRPEKSRLRDASLWSGLEADSRGGSGEGQSLPQLRENTYREQEGTSRSSFEALSLRGNESQSKSCGSVRLVPSPDRGRNNKSTLVDHHRCEPRRVIGDGECGWSTTVARVCSWCGLPDRNWVESLVPLGTSLKPAHEPIVVARKPLIGTVAANILKHGTGAINIDGCRVEAGSDLGRWPANVIHDGSDEVLDAFPDAPGQQAPVKGDEPSASTKNVYGERKRVAFGTREGEASANRRYTEKGSTNFAALPGERRFDTGSAARFFYCAKPSKKERNLGLDEKAFPGGNTHPTVKPVALMKYLIRLITPPGGLVLDPFVGSGTTGIAAVEEGFRFIGIDLDTEDTWLRIAEQRISAANSKSTGAPEY